MHCKFDPEFINRIDRSLHYQAVSADALPQLVEIELEKLNHRLKHQQRKFNSLQQLKSIFISDMIHYGVRHLGHKIRTELEPILALYFLSHPEKSEMFFYCSAD